MTSHSHWDLLLDFSYLDIPVRKYRSAKTGITVCLAGVEGPLVNGFFTLATEAHDDDGLPHTLEHLVFMGSERYPYKGVLDLFANRCLAQGTNAWTDTDHTCYTINTAGSEGFLNLLPIYLDHILYPTLTDSAFLTEVHHVNEEGENAGVVYCEMQARENTGESLAHLNLLRNLYPGHCGCKSETGGIMANLRESCSNIKVRQYHKSFYRPDNLCMIITGQVDACDVFKAMTQFEEKVIAKGSLPAMERPWSSPTPPFKESKGHVISFPTDDMSTGLVKFGWRGPKTSDHLGMTAVRVLWEYLTDTPVAPLQRALVETDDPYCSDVKYGQVDFPEGCIIVSLKNVPFGKLKQTKEKVELLLKDISSGNESFDMTRMTSVIHRQILDALDKMEDHGHETFAFMAIGDFLYSSDQEELKVRVDEVGRLEILKEKPSDYWTKLLDQYFVSSPSVVMIGEPSGELSEKMQKDEKVRVEKQRETLGENGLKRKGDELAKAIEENEVEPPDDLVASVAVPGIDSIRFHPVETRTNRRGENDASTSRFPLERMPFQFQLDDIHTSFVQITALLDTTPVPDSLKAYLPLFAELLCESPLMRNGVLVSHEEVIAELAADTLSSEASFGISGRRFAPGAFPQLISLTLKVEMKKYERGVQWMQELLYQTQFTAERIKIIAARMLNEISSIKRNGMKVTRALSSSFNFQPESILRISSFLTQQEFLTRLVKALEENPKEVVTSLDRICSCLADPSKVRIHMATDVKKLPKDAHVPWENFFNTLSFPSLGVLLCPAEVTCSSKLQLQETSSMGCIAGVGSVESSFLIQTSPGITTYDHADLPALMVFMEYLCALEGPLWRQVRGMGLAYHYNMYSNVEHGLLYFILFKSTHVVKAYEESKKIVNGFLSGESEFDPVQLESAKSSVIFEIIEREKSAFDAAKQSLMSEFRHVDYDYNRVLLKKIAAVAIDDLHRVGETYVKVLFDASKSKCAMCCNPSKVDEIKDAFERDLDVIQCN